MDLPKKYLKDQNKSASFAFIVSAIVFIIVLALGVLSKNNTIKDLNYILPIGLAVVAILFLINGILFTARSKSINRLIANPIVHWTYNQQDDTWVIDKRTETIISSDSLFYTPAPDKLYTFWSPYCKLDSIKLDRLPGTDYKAIIFYFIKAITFEGRAISSTIYVPIPKEHEHLGEEIVSKLGNDMLKNKHNRFKFFLMVCLFIVLSIVILALIAKFFMS